MNLEHILVTKTIVLRSKSPCYQTPKFHHTGNDTRYLLPSPLSLSMVIPLNVVSECQEGAWLGFCLQTPVVQNSLQDGRSSKACRNAAVGGKAQEKTISKHSSLLKPQPLESQVMCASWIMAPSYLLNHVLGRWYQKSVIIEPHRTGHLWRKEICFLQFWKLGSLRSTKRTKSGENLFVQVRVMMKPEAAQGVWCKTAQLCQRKPAFMAKPLPPLPIKPLIQVD